MAQTAPQRNKRLRDRLGRLAQVVCDPRPQASCEQCLELLPDYVIAERQSADALRLYPHVRAHLENCLDCQAQYADQLAVARLEASDALPRLAQAPRFDLSFLPQRPSPAQFIYGSIKAIVQAAHSDLVVELELVQDKLVETLDRLVSHPLILPLQVAPAQALGLTGKLPVLPWAMATLIGLQKIRATTTCEEIERMKQAGQLDKFLASIAQEAAQQAGLAGRRNKRKFAAEFARAHSEERWSELLAWLEQPKR